MLMSFERETHPLLRMPFPMALPRGNAGLIATMIMALAGLGGHPSAVTAQNSARAKSPVVKQQGTPRKVAPKVAKKPKAEPPPPTWPVAGPDPMAGSILPNKRIVAFYGNPLSKKMGLSLIHISEPTRQAEISYAVFCLKK